VDAVPVLGAAAHRDERGGSSPRGTRPRGGEPVIGATSIALADATAVAEVVDVVGLRVATPDADRDSAVEALEIQGVLRILEPAATAMAATRLGERDLVELARALSEMDAAVTSEAFVDAHYRFHAAIVAAGGNAVLIALIHALAASLEQVHSQPASAEARAAASRCHRDIYEALRAGDPKQARAAAIVHLAQEEHGAMRAALGRHASSRHAKSI
jgi:DNA-binding FadR family transcriptional regulator